MSLGGVVVEAGTIVKSTTAVSTIATAVVAFTTAVLAAFQFTAMATALLVADIAISITIIVSVKRFVAVGPGQGPKREGAPGLELCALVQAPLRFTPPPISA
jgi:hypothetical protein